MEGRIKNSNSCRDTESTEVDCIVDETLAMPTEVELQAKVEAEAKQSADDELNHDFDNCIVDMSEEIDEGEAVLAITDPTTGKDVAICRTEDLVTIKAAPKSGKSTLMTIFIVAFICYKWERVKSYLRNPRIIYFDTEMKRSDTQRIGRKALRMAGMPENVNPPDFTCVNLRQFSPDEIVTNVEEMIKIFKPNVVFIDGSLDLVNNFNDIEECNQLVKQKYLKWMSAYKCTIITAIHTNKTNDLHQSQGHLGALLDKKGEITLECQRDKVTNIVTVSAPTCRHTEVPEFSFKYGEDGLPISCDDIVAELKVQSQVDKDLKKQQKQETEYNNLLRYTRQVMQGVGTEGVSQGDLASLLMPKLNIKRSAAQAKIKQMVDNGDLMKTGYNGNLVLRQFSDTSES